MKRWIALASAAMVSAALHAANATPAADHAVGVVHVTNPELLSALQNLKASLTAERTPLVFDNGASAKNCLEYSDLLSKSQPVESTRNFEIRSEYRLCDSIRVITGKPFVAQKAAASGKQAKTLYEKLDLRSFPRRCAIAPMARSTRSRRCCPARPSPKAAPSRWKPRSSSSAWRSWAPSTTAGATRPNGSSG